MSDKEEDAPSKQLKIVIVGDGSSGKVGLLYAVARREVLVCRPWPGVCPANLGTVVASFYFMGLILIRRNISTIFFKFNLIKSGIRVGLGLGLRVGDRIRVFC